MNARFLFGLAVGVIALSRSLESAGGDSPESQGPIIVRSGERTPIEVPVPTAISEGRSDKAVLLELKNVVLPARVMGLRVFVVAQDTTGVLKTRYLTSISRGQTADSIRPETFAVEIAHSLAGSKGDLSGLAPTGKLTLLLEPILQSSQKESDPVRVGQVLLKAD